MRFREFRKPLFEFQMPSADRPESLSLLPYIVKSTPPTDPTHKQALGIMQQLIQTADKLKDNSEQPQAQPAPAPKQPPAPQQQIPQNTIGKDSSQPLQPVPPSRHPVVQNQPIQERISSEEELLAEFERRLQDEKEYTFLRTALSSGLPGAAQQIEKLKKDFVAAHQQGVQEGMAELFERDQKFHAELKILIAELTKKINGSMEAMHEADVESAEVENREPKPKPKAVTGNTITRQVENALMAFFGRLSYEGSNTVEEYAKKKNTVIKFMNDCTEGVFNFDELMSKKRGNIKELIGMGVELDDETRQDYIALFDEIQPKVLSAVVGGGGGAWGPGELGIAMLATPVKKAKGKGDLLVGNTPIEIKSSANKDKGARIGGKGTNNGSSVKPAYIDALKLLCDKAGFDDYKNVGNKKEEIMVKAGRGKPAVGTGKFEWKKGVNFTSLTTPTFFNNLYNNVIKNIPKGSRVRQAQNFMFNVCNIALKPEVRNFVTRELTDAMVDQTTGAISYEVFIRNWTQILLSVYLASDEVKAILVLNPVSGTFHYLTNAKQFVNAIDKERKKPGTGIVVTGGIDFADAQGKTSPQYGVA